MFERAIVMEDRDRIPTSVRDRPVPTRARYAIQILALAVGYTLLGWVGQKLAPPPGYASLIWPASGLAIAGLTAFGWRTWPGVFAGAMIVNTMAVGSNALLGSTSVALGAGAMAAGATLQALCAVYWIRSRAGYPLRLSRWQDVASLTLLVGPVTCIISASVGTATLYANGFLAAPAAPGFWLSWWSGDLGGVLIALPLLLLAPGARDKVFWRGEALSPFSKLAFAAILVLLCGTLTAWRMNMEATYQRSLTSFDALATDSQQALQFRMQSYARALNSAAAMLRTSETVTPDEWRTYVSNLNLSRDLPGIQGIGLIAPVDTSMGSQSLESFLDRDLRIHPMTGRDEKFVIVAIEPEADNTAALGLDIAFERSRRQAALHARDTGRPTITQRILLVQDETKSSGFLLLRPIFRPGMPTATLTQRRAAFDGWIYAPFIAPRFMNALTPSQGELFDITIYDGPSADPNRVIFNSAEGQTSSRSSDFTVQRTFRMMEQPWTVVWRSKRAFEHGVNTREADLVLGGGLFLTYLFAGLLLAGSRRETSTRQQIEQRTAELEQTVAALAESERNFGDLAGLSPAGIFRTDPYGFCSYVNEAWLEATGLKPSEALGAGWLSAVHPEARSRVRQEWITAVNTAQSIRIEVQFAKADGSSRCVDLIAAPRFDNSGEVEGFIGVGIDITQHKQAVDALRESEERFQTLASFAPAAIFRTTDNGGCTYVNPAWCRMSGLTEDEAMGLGWQNAVHPDDVGRLTKDWRDAVQNKIPYRGEFRWLHKNGTITWVDAIAQPQLNEAGVLQGYIGVAIDITERRHFERAVAERDAQLTLLAQHATDAVFRIGLDLNCIYASPSVSEVLGIPPESIIGKPAFGLLHPDDEENVRSAFGKLRSGQADRIVVSYRSRIRRSSDEYRWCEATAALIRDPELDTPREISASVRDIGDRKQMEMDLISARRHAEAAAAAKATFLANMSHEIRTPMNGVIGFTDMLLDGDLSPQQRENAELIAESGRAMMQILNDILDVSKIDAGQMKIVPEPVDLRHKLASCTRLLEPSARQKGLGFSLSIDDDVPAFVMADRLRLRQIITNLIGNAIKFTSEGSIRTRACVERVPHGQDLLVIAVEDTGIGIPADRLEAIFREFSQADESTAREFGGTGLGLTISSELAKLMGGRLQVDSVHGQGSVFTLRIPLGRATSAGPVSSEEKAEKNIAFARPPRILVAEDHDINQALILSMGKRMGLKLSIAANGQEAVQMVHEAKDKGEPYDLLLMDVQMPVMDGLEATKRLRDDGFTSEELPILAQTANAYREDVERCLVAGMQDHLAKPIRIQELKTAIRMWIPSELQLPDDTPAKPADATSGDVEQALRKRYLERRDKTIGALESLGGGSVPTRDKIEDVAQMLHKLAGAAGMFGEEELGEIAAAQEKALLDADPDDLANVVGSAIAALSDRT